MSTKSFRFIGLTYRARKLGALVVTVYVVATHLTVYVSWDNPLPRVCLPRRKITDPLEDPICFL